MFANIVIIICGSGSKEYFEVLFDNNQFTELFANLTSGDPLQFHGQQAIY